LLASVLAPSGLLRLIVLATLILQGAMMLAATVWMLIAESRKVNPANAVAAPSARLILASLLLAELPLILTAMGAAKGFNLPRDITAASQLLLPLGIAAAILWRNPFGVDPMLRRGLSFSVVALVVMAVNVALAFALIEIIATIGEPYRGLVILAALIVAGALYTWVRVWVQAAIERAVFPEQQQLFRELNRAQLALGQSVRREAVMKLLTDELPQRLGAAWAVLQSTDDPPPGVDTRTWNARLVAGDTSYGRYWLGPRPTCLSYTAVEQERLRAFAQQAALALAYTEAVEELHNLNIELEDRVARRSAQLLAQQRELVALGERQRIARDLHDSVKQSIFSLGLGLRAVRTQIASNPARALHTLREQEAIAVQAQSEMGTLLAQLRGRGSDSEDFISWLRSHCDELLHSYGLVVRLTVAATVTLADDECFEVQQIVREVLHNVVKHSGVATAHLSLCEEAGAIVLSMWDEGRGFDLAAVRERQQGLGLRGLTERATAIGAALMIDTAPGRGTAVQLTLGRQSND
jgi:signal transduction histidine kinase